ncbi:MAG: GerMN domain-containing protein [Acidimicrobiia bacterium]|nr:GerMN domain-containing protein [Acidimicrobiia bacterium]
MKPIRSFAWLVLVTLVTAACGSGTANTTVTSSTSTTTTSSTSTTLTIPPSTSTTPPPVTQDVEVFFATGDGSNCAEVTGFTRSVAADLDPLTTALDLLVLGPNAEEISSGAGSFFSAETDGAIRHVRTSEGELVVDFRDVRVALSNASTSCGSESLLAQLNGTVFQFDSIERVRYELEGSCDQFFNWLQRECVEYTRLGPEPADLSTNERALGSGCTPDSDVLGDGRWFGFVVEADETGVGFDLACWFGGSAAADAAAEDGEESPPPNDYYIRNVNDQLRSIDVWESAFVTWLPTADPADTRTSPYAEWLAEWPARSYRPGIWIEIENGVIVHIDEQYVP